MAWRPWTAAVVLAAAGVGLRIVLTLAGFPPINSDEATAGLAAQHIAEGRHFPVFFYGQHYLGTVYSYLAAPFVWLFGPGALRLPALGLYAVFLAVMYHLTRRLFGAPWFAAFVVGVLAFGADRVVKNQLIGGGLYPESLPAAAGLFLLAVQRRYVWWGLLAGLMVWDAWNTLPFVAASGLLLGRSLWKAIPSTLVGALPLLAFEPMESVRAFVALNQAGGFVEWGSRLYGGVVQGVPLALGMCEGRECARWQLAWAPVLLVLLVVSARFSRAALLLCLAAAVTIVRYARSPAAGLTPAESARYLHLLLVAVPVFLWPLWHFRLSLCRGLLVGTLAWATLGSFVSTLDSRAVVREQAALVRGLRAHGIDAFYSEYWSCGWVAFVTREKVVCSVIDGLDRYPYRRHPQAIVVPAGSAFEVSVVRRLGTTRYEVLELPGYRVYRLGWLP